MDEHPEILAKYPRFVETLVKYHVEDKAPKILEYTPRYDWQTSIIDMIATTPNDRQILWVYDLVGNFGKTYLSKHLVHKHNAFYCNGGKAADITYAYAGEPIVVFDYVRDAKEFVNYGVIEQLKNGMLFSSKYESGVKSYAVPHVMVFANFAPEADKFSSDRIVLIELDSIHMTRKV